MRLDWYIFVEWFKVFLLSLMAIVGILFLEAVQNELQDLLRFGASWDEVVVYYAILMPSFLPMVIPIALMVSVLFVLGQFHRHQEITAMRSCGLSLLRISRTLWLSAAVLAYALFELNGRITPWSIEQSRSIYDNLRFASELTEVDEEEVGLLYNLTFLNHADDRTWFINRFNEYNYRAFGVNVYELGPDGRERRRVVANEGYYEPHREHWVFIQGRFFDFDPETGDPIRSLPFEREVFEEYYEDPELMKFLEKRPKDLSFHELREILAALDPDQDPRVAAYAVRYYGMVMNPLSCLIVMGLAIPFAVAGVRTNPMVGVSKAMGLFLGYYVLVQFSHLMAGGMLSPFWAAALPNLLASAVAVWFHLQAARPAA